MSEISFKHPLPLSLLTKSQKLFVGGKRGQKSSTLSTRYYLKKWRARRDCLLTLGVPRVSSVILPSFNNHAYFSWNNNSSSSIYVPANGAYLQVGSTPRSQKWSDDLVLLHEWGHAYLYPPSDTFWMKYLSEETLFHAHPAWAHVDNYPGWRIFNEMFSDVWATAWLLRLSNRDLGVIDLLYSLKTHRRFHEIHFDSLDFPCVHTTYEALQMASFELWNLPVNEMVEKIFLITDKAFLKWLDRDINSGRDICSVGLDHLKFLDDKWTIPSSELTVRGRTWKMPGRPVNNLSKNLLLSLKDLNPSHPLLSFKSSIRCLE